MVCSQLEIKKCYHAKDATNILAADLLLQSYDCQVESVGGVLKLGKGEDALAINVVNGQWTCVFNTALSGPMALTRREFHSQYPLPGGRLNSLAQLLGVRITQGNSLPCDLCDLANRKDAPHPGKISSSTR